MPFQAKPPAQRPLVETLAIAAIGLTLPCVVFFSRHFVKLRLGPVYALEIVALIWAIAMLARGKSAVLGFLKSAFRESGAVPKLALLFFAVGFARLACDFPFAWHGTPPLRQVLQHGLVFVYPLTWILIGIWTARQSFEILPFAVAAMVAASIPSYIFFSYSDLATDPLMTGLGANYAIGPLAVVLAAYFFSTVFTQQRISAAKYFAAGTLAAAAAFFPYWKMLHTHLQRSSLVLLFMMIFATPWLVHKERRVKALSVSLLLTAFFALGAFVSLGSNVGSRAYESLRHYDDHFQPEKDEPGKEIAGFRFKSRAFWWKTAFEDWKTAPVFGVGLLPNVPSKILPGVANDGRFEGYSDLVSLGGKPVAGPHNSYLGILARFGIVGMAAFLALTFAIVRATAKFARETDFERGRPLNKLADLLTVLVPVNGMLYAFMGIGFESPHNSVLLWFFAGALLRRSCK